MGNKNRTSTHHLPVLILFVIITAVMTYPAVFQWTGRIIGDYGDSLFNSWILAWDVHKLIRGEFLSLFDANIFYPYTNTLAYSENMLGNAILALPILVTTGNPVLAYNVTFLTCLVLSAFGMYLLVFDQTQSKSAAIVSGIIFAFFPWRFAHLSHIQLQAAQWFPFTFLYAHRFFKQGDNKNLLLFTLFFVLQFLSCGYYGLYNTLFVGLLIAFNLIQPKIPLKTLLPKIGLFGALSAIFIFPVLLPYIRVKNEMGFHRTINESIYFSADLLSYFSTTDINLLWGKITQVFWKPEGELFLGLTAIGLGLVGIYSVITKRTIPENQPLPAQKPNGIIRNLQSILPVFMALDCLAILLITTTGGISTTIGSVNISATHIRKPFYVLLFLVALWVFFSYKTREPLIPLKFTFNSPSSRFYFWVLLLSLLFSFGPIIHLNNHPFFPGPYFFLYWCFPGFDGLRVPSRFVITVALSLSVFAGLGWARLSTRFQSHWKKKVSTIGVCLILLLEYASFPLTMVPIDVGDRVPAVYRWLAEQKDDPVILELPLPDKPTDVWKEAERVYFSIYHWERMVNGYSGYFPPSYDDLYMKKLKGFPSNQTIELIKNLGVTYLIIHLDSYEGSERKKLTDLLEKFPNDIKLLAKFGEQFVYKVIP